MIWVWGQTGLPQVPVHLRGCAWELQCFPQDGDVVHDLPTTPHSLSVQHCAEPRSPEISSGSISYSGSFPSIPHIIISAKVCLHCFSHNQNLTVVQEVSLFLGWSDTCIGSMLHQGLSIENSSHRMAPNAYESAALLSRPSVSSSGGMWVTCKKSESRLTTTAHRMTKKACGLIGKISKYVLHAPRTWTIGSRGLNSREGGNPCRYEWPFW